MPIDRTFELSYHSGAPDVDDDISIGYEKGHIWVNSTNSTAFLLVDDTDGAADWVNITAQPGTAEWGDIIGTLADQTDLQAALDAKIADAPSDGSTYGRNNGSWTVIAGGGDVVGPASAVDNRLATFDGTTGKLIQDSGTLISDLATASQGALADSALQSGDNVSELTNDAGYLTDITGQALGSLSDVVITGTPADNELLAYDSGSGDWINQTASEAGLASAAQGALADSATQPGDNVSTLTNDANYVASGDNVSDLTNDAGYLSSLNGSTIQQLGNVNSAAPTGSEDGYVYVWDNTAGEFVLEAQSGGGGGGDVDGPASSVDNRIATFDGTTGKLIQDSGSLVSDFATSAQGALADSALQDVVDDTTPQLGGNLDLNGNNINGTGSINNITSVSTTSNIEAGGAVTTAQQLVVIPGSDTDTNLILAFVTGNPTLSWDESEDEFAFSKGLQVNNGDLTVPNAAEVTLGNFVFDADQTVGAGQDNYVLTYDDSSGTISLEAATGGGIAAVVDDTSPQLGGDLDVNGNLIEGRSLSTATVQTTDATQTTLATYTIPTDDERVITARVRAHEDATDDSYWYVTTVGVKNVGGTASLIGSESVSTGGDAGTSSWDVEIDVSGATARIRVTGEASHTIDWVTHTEVS